ncbi:sigma factor algU negative regulatory protein MucB [Hahella chejuensis KCTC 2396]|uniref:Sigma factor algU negative regulatory protein MucB n=1 Tax=Hahella chejuensis (strain KCTC 2396) TaxID=349521 RepID=Q2SL38_HAHCH|nr:MucB/RseB C-terminal domain-containing protein [Hahella chejuensis]ABC28636.1 sigma factor algU negative regulatory protein MucB [Hahella chejuensis KCTC 2396]
MKRVICKLAAIKDDVRQWSLVSLLALISLVSAPAQASGPQEWLQRMLEARQELSYRGAFIYSRGDEMSSMKVFHRTQDGVEKERLVAMDGEMREIIRDGDMLICVFPGGKQVRLEQAAYTGPFPGAVLNGGSDVHSVYELRMAGEERVAGHDVLKMAVMAKDQYRYSYYLWLEKNSGMLLKSLLTNRKGEVLEHFQYTVLELGAQVTDQELAPSMPKADVKSVKPEQEEAPDALPEQWTPAWLPKGFSMSPNVTKRNDVMPGDMRTQVYGDGLTMFSIFVEENNPQAMPEGASRMGATTAYSKHIKQGDMTYVITVVGEVPIETVKRVADNMKSSPSAGDAS